MLASWKKSYDQTRELVKSRDIILPTKVCLVKAMVFPVVMYGCESWTIKKAEHWRIDTFELWCWRRLLGHLGLCRTWSEFCGQSWARAGDLEWVPPPHLLRRGGSSLAPPPSGTPGTFTKIPHLLFPRPPDPELDFISWTLFVHFKNSYLYGNQLIFKK